MIVCIQEHYDGECSLVWFADTSKARQAFVTVINKAIADDDKSISVPYGTKVGMQGGVDYDQCHVKLPCMVEEYIEIYNE
jgi:hypothetical protein